MIAYGLQGDVGLLLETIHGVVHQGLGGCVDTEHALTVARELSKLAYLNLEAGTGKLGCCRMVAFDPKSEETPA